jgi:hypothetical protein
MVWDNSPWAIEGGQTSADVGRLLAWHATSGIAGVAKPTDLRVRALSVPGGSVLVGKGAVTIPVNALGKYLQSYIGSNPSDDTVAIPATGTGGGRSDLIVARVENPISGEPWSAPADALNGQYIYSRRYPSVPAGTTHVAQVDPAASAYTLARIDIPANTGTITDNMIVDLRGVTSVTPAAPTTPAPADPPLPTTPYCAANQDFYSVIDFDRSTVVEDTLLYSQSSYKLWPTAAKWNICVPNDACQAIVMIACDVEQRPVAGQASNLANVWGYFRIRVVGSGYDVSTDVEFDKDYYGGGSPTTTTVRTGGTLPMTSAARGKTLSFQCEARQFTDSATKGKLVVCKGSFITAHVHFVIAPTST